MEDRAPVLGPGDDRAGWLVRCLSEFAFRGVNLTRIESRPRREGLGAYMFFVDLDGAAGTPAVAEAIEALRAHAAAVRVLGSFPTAPLAYTSAQDGERRTTRPSGVRVARRPPAART